MRNHSQHGFTLIEMIVSLGVFAVVVTITTGALLTLIASNQRFQNEQNVMTNLSFALDSMTRELRTGFNYYCISAASDTGVFTDGSTSGVQAGFAASTQNCPSGRPANNNYHGVSFWEGGRSVSGSAVAVPRIMYFYDAVLKKIFRKIGDEAPQSLVSDSIEITDANFFVTHTGRLFATSGGDAFQPTVTIQIRAKAKNDTSLSAKVYYIQSTVTQRPLDL